MVQRPRSFGKNRVPEPQSALSIHHCEKWISNITKELQFGDGIAPRYGGIVSSNCRSPPALTEGGPMRIHVISAALLAFALSCATMGQNNAQLKQAPQGPATTIPLSTGTPINASLVG